MLALLIPLLAASAAPALRDPQAGDRYEIVRVKETQSHDNENGTGSSFDRDTFVERVVRVDAAGVEVEFDLPDGTKAADRAREWMLPARVLRPANGPLQLLNRPELERRLDVWLKKGEMTREACGKWMFTWTAFQIVCDPEAVITVFTPLDFSRIELRDGAPYRDPLASEAALLLRTKEVAYVTEAPVDQEQVRRQRAEGAVVVAQFSQETLTLETALRAEAGNTISGNIKVTFETDADGAPLRRTRVITLRIAEAGGKIEDSKVTETVERKRLPKAS